MGQRRMSGERGGRQVRCGPGGRGMLVEQVFF